MVVEITEDVVEYLESHKEELNDQSDIIVMLDEIARQCYEHHHVIYAEVDVLEYLKNCGILENRSKRVFSALFRRAFKLKSYVDVTRYRIVYSTEVNCNTLKETSVYKGYKQDKIEMRGDRAEMSDFPLYLNTVAGGLDCRDQTIGGFSFVVKIYALPVVEIIG